MQSVPSRSSRRKAFTLLEILLVVAILGILAILISFMMGRIRANVQKIQCTSNLRELGRIALLYAAEHHQNLIPLRRENDGDPPGFWYDHLHYYVGREFGRAGRNVGGVKVNYPGFDCFFLKKRYVINRLCGYSRAASEGPRVYLKLGQGFANGAVFELPGGMSGTAWFACPREDGEGESFLPENYASGNASFIGFPHARTCNVLFMDGHVENMGDPGFETDPAQLREERWVRFFGKAP